MVSRVMIVCALLMMVSDSSPALHIDYGALFRGGRSLKLEQPEIGRTGENLMNSGDYSGCTLVRMVSAPGPGKSPAGREGVVPAVQYVEKRVSASVSGW